MKQEGALKGRFTRELAKRAPGFLNLLQLTAGAPDRAIVGNGVASFWEFKHGTPKFESPGLQELMCMRLAEQGFCRYVLWLEDRHGDCRETLIVLPRQVHDKVYLDHFQFRCDGHDMKWLVAQVLKVHGVSI